MPFNKSTGKYWACQFIGWGSYAIINCFFAYAFSRITKEFFDRLSIFVAAGLITSHLMRIMIKRLRILKWSFPEQILTLAFILMVGSIFMGAVDRFANEFFHHFSANENSPGIPKYFLQTSFMCFIYLFFWLSFYYIFHLISNVMSKRPNTI